MITRVQTGGQQVPRSRVTAVAARAMRWSAWLLGLFAVVLLVAGIVVGIGLRSAEPAAPVHSVAEQAQLDAEGRYRALAAHARAAAAHQPALGERLATVAADLDAQADAVALPRSPAAEGTGAPGDGAESAGPVPSPGGSTTTPGTGAPMDGPHLLSMLRDSALRSLQDAVDAEPGPARVLAAAGANQWRQAVLLGQVLGAEPGLPPADALSPADLTTDTPAPDPSADPAGPADTPVPAPTADGADPAVPGDCAGTPLVAEDDRRALLDAKRAEDEARYGYEVAAALLPDPAAALARSAVHRSAAGTAARRLTELCVPVAPAPAGFAIGPAFRADPEEALRELEQDHAELYAGLVSAVGPEVRAWAVTSYNAAVQRSLEAGTPLDAFPGLEAGSPDGEPTPEAPPTPEGPPAPAGPNGG